MRIIILGAGDIGVFLAKNLSNDHDIVVIEKNKETFQRIQGTMDVLTLLGDGDNPHVLDEAGLEDTDVMLAVSGDDKTNILASMLSHSKGVEKIIARINNPEYLNYPQLLNTPFISTVNPVSIFADNITNLIGAPFAVKTETFGRGKIQMLKIIVDEQSPIVNKKLSELGPPKAWIFVAVSRDGEISIPTGDTMLEPGDCIFALGKPSDVHSLKDLLGVEEEGVNSVIIVGAGKYGKMVAKKLSKRGISVKLIEMDSDRAEAAAIELPELSVFRGDGNSADTLKEAGISSTDYLIALTGDDENNVLSALLAKSLGAKKSIVLYTKADYINVIESIGVSRALSVRLATANEILSFLHLGGVAHVVLVEEGKAEVLEFVITSGSRILGTPLRDCKFPKGALVGIVLSGDGVIIPRGDYTPVEGDRLIVFALPGAVKDLEKMLG